MNYKEIADILSYMENACEQLPNKEELGEQAMELISDYPLYVSGTDNISYGLAIAIATLTGGDIEKQLKELKDWKESEPLLKEYFKTDRVHSLEDFEVWKGERNG